MLDVEMDKLKGLCETHVSAYTNEIGSTKPWTYILVWEHTSTNCKVIIWEFCVKKHCELILN